MTFKRWLLFQESAPVIEDVSQLSLTDIKPPDVPPGSSSKREMLESPHVVSYARRYIPDLWLASLSAPISEIEKQTLPAQSSSEAHKIPKELEQEVEGAFQAAREEIFADGMESQFSKKLLALIQTHGDLVMGAINSIISSKNSSAEVIAEAMRWLGQLRDKDTHLYRIWILRQGLKNNSPRIRDGALLGLSFLGDTRVIPDLEQAYDRESLAELKSDIQAVLDWLERSR